MKKTNEMIKADMLENVNGGCVYPNLYPNLEMEEKEISQVTGPVINPELLNRWMNGQRIPIIRNRDTIREWKPDYVKLR